jgi:hypothetical protein
LSAGVPERKRGGIGKNGEKITAIEWKGEKTEWGREGKVKTVGETWVGKRA